MMGRVYKLCWLLFVLCFVACQPTTLTPKAYIDWVQNTENGLHPVKEIQSHRFDLQYRPSTLVALQEFAGENFDEEKIAARTKELGELQYYNLKLFGPEGHAFISKANDQTTYFKKLEYYGSMAQSDISIAQEGDTLACVLYHLERYYDLSPYNTLVLAFPAPKVADAERTFVFNDYMLNKGPIKFHFSSSDFNKIPNIEIP